jgi:hypothetical protein
MLDLLELHRESVVRTGESLVDRVSVYSIRKLWEGDLLPGDLPIIENGLRALLISKKVKLSSISGLYPGSDRNYSLIDVKDYSPFGVDLLDEKISPLPDIRGSKKILASNEALHLESYIIRELQKIALESIPHWIKLTGEAIAFLDHWYEGCSQEECEQAAKIMDGWEDFSTPYNKQEIIEVHPIFTGEALNDAIHLVEKYRLGSDIYSTIPIGMVCKEFVFSEWPSKIFNEFEEEFIKLSRQMRGPGCAVELPPLTLLVLSRTEKRESIPNIIGDLWWEYYGDRHDLWSTLDQAWEVERLEEQLDLFRKLSSASKNLFKATFPERFDSLSLGLDLAKLSPGGLASGMKSIREHDKPLAKVKAVSFAYRLSKDFRKHLITSKKALEKVLSDSERRRFGF